MLHRLGRLCAVVAIATSSVFASTVSAGTITETTLSSYSNPFVFDFQSPAEGAVSGTDVYFTANGINSITAVSETTTDTYTSFAPSDKGLFHNQSSGSLLIDDYRGTERPFGNDTIFTFDLATPQHRFGFEILDQLGSNYLLSFYNGGTSVGTFAFNYSTRNVVRYFENTDLFDRVVIDGLDNTGYGLDNVTIEDSSAISTVPEPASVIVWALGALGFAAGAYRRKRRS